MLNQISATSLAFNWEMCLLSPRLPIVILSVLRLWLECTVRISCLAVWISDLGSSRCDLSPACAAHMCEESAWKWRPRRGESIRLSLGPGAWESVLLRSTFYVLHSTLYRDRDSKEDVDMRICWMLSRRQLLLFVKTLAWNSLWGEASEMKCICQIHMHRTAYVNAVSCRPKTKRNSISNNHRRGEASSTNSA